MLIVIKEYCKARYKLALLMLVFMGIFIVIPALYQVPLFALLDSVRLVLFLALIAVIFDYIGFRRKHKQLHHLLSGITASLSDLPEGGDLIERDYQALLTLLYAHMAKFVSESDSAQTEMTDYYTMWAHQIKTPIAALQLLLAEDGHDLQGSMEQELFKIEQYVDMVLQYLRIKTMSNDLVLCSYPLEPIVKQCVKKYATIFIHKRISLQMNSLDCMVLTDEKWLMLMVEQILSNALKYTPEEGSIHIYLQEEKTLCIVDTGIGIREEDITRVFDKGFTGYNGRLNQKSSGIGLYLCRQIAEKLSHTVSISSKVGEGTMVKLELSADSLELF